MNLASSITPTSIVVNAKLYNSSKAVTLSVNGSATQSVTSSFSDLTYAITSEISYIQLNSSQYCWINSITVNYAPAGEPNSITAITNQSVDLYGSITLTPQSNNGTTPFTFSTTSQAISLTPINDGKSCSVEGLEVTGETPAVVTISQAAGTHNETNYMSASTTVNVSVIDNRPLPEITLTNVPTKMNIFEEQTVTVSTLSTGTRSVESTDDNILAADIDNDGNISLHAGVAGEATITLSVDGTETYKPATETFTVTVEDNRTVPTFAFDNTNVVVEWDERESFTAPTLTNTSDGTVSYSSSKTSVATVDASGNITFVGGGTTVITASVTGSSTYKDAEASYTLVVNKPYSFTETFDNASVSGSTLNNADNTGWAFSTAYAENSGVGETKCMRLASGSAGGYITTPTLTGLPEKAVMTFDAKSYGSDTDVTLSISGSGCTVNPSSVTLTSTYANYTISITKTGDTPKITISATTKKRAFVDNVSITDIPYATIAIDDAEVKAGKTVTLNITTNSTGAFSFVSSDNSIATVAQDGDDYVVTGVSEGAATITAIQAATDYYKATTTTFEVTVISASTAVAPTFTVASGETVEVGSTITIEAEENCTIKYTTDNTDPATSATATTTSSNTAVITVPTGVASLTLRAVTINGENVSSETTATYTVVKKTLVASFDAASITVAIGADADEPVLTNPSNGTVTWESSDDDVVTIDENGQLTAIAEGTATITANIAATDEYLAGSATYTVNVYDPTLIVVNFNNNPFGLTSNKIEDNFSLTYKGITFNFDKNGGNNAVRIDASNGGYARIYASNKMTLTPPSGYYFTKIEFDFSEGSLKLGDDIYDEKDSWSGVSDNLTFIGNVKAFINKMTFTLKAGSVVNISSVNYATFSSTSAHDFSGTDVKAYTAKVDGGVVKLSEISDGIVPAGEGVILYAATAKTYGIPATTTSATLTDNELVGVTTRTLVAKTGGAGYNYIMQSNGSGGIVFNMATEPGAYMPAGKAYLSTTVDASANNARLSVVFADETEGINATLVNNENVTGKVYDLQGRCVAHPTKGLYFVNGKKVIVK